jgi:predicted glycoside hydrolase/deacetylase ChbG (UPF0249 family)
MTGDIRLLVRADDAGSSWSSNMGCNYACIEGIAKSVEVMMPCAWVSHAASLFNDRSDIDVGIHLTLTSEWDAIKWRPLTKATSLIDQNGNFFPLVTPRDGDKRQSLAEVDWSIDEIAAELRAQITLGVKMFKGASHISSHMMKHFKEFDPKIGEVISDLCLEFELADDAFGHGLKRIEGYPKFPRETNSRTAAFIQQITQLSSGTYIFIDHPATFSEELMAMGHTGYEDVASDRTSCLKTLTSLNLRQCIDELGIELISYRDLYG